MKEDDGWPGTAGSDILPRVPNVDERTFESRRERHDTHASPSDVHSAVLLKTCHVQRWILAVRRSHIVAHRPRRQLRAETRLRGSADRMRLAYHNHALDQKTFSGGVSGQPFSAVTPGQVTHFFVEHEGAMAPSDGEHPTHVQLSEATLDHR